MSAKIIDGKALALSIREEIKNEIASFGDNKPGLAVILVGEDPASAVYVRNKEKACEEVGITSYSYRLPATATQVEVEDLVKNLAEDKKITGILVQLPLPRGLDESKILSLIPAEKDVDGFSSVNVGKMLLGEDCLVACTPHGIIKLIKYAGVDIAGKRAVVVGRSYIVGKPVSILLLKENATVTICHSKTQNLAEICRTADILVVAIGKAGFITADMIKQGATVIDVGTNRVDGKLVGDVDFDNAKDVASAITPVPGGVGPMTITMLMYNTVKAYKRGNNLE